MIIKLMYTYVLFPISIYLPFLIYNYFLKKKEIINIYFEKNCENFIKCKEILNKPYLFNFTNETIFHLYYKDIYYTSINELIETFTNNCFNYHYIDDIISQKVILHVMHDDEYNIKLFNEIRNLNCKINLIENHQHLD